MENRCFIDKKPCDKACMAYAANRKNPRGNDTCHFVEATAAVKKVAQLIVNTGSLCITTKPSTVGRFPQSASPPEVRT